MDELEALRLRDEVLQALYWMRSERLADAPTAAELARFLAIARDELAPYLERFAADGQLERLDGDRVRLTATGEESGKRTFAQEFADVTKASHGECDESCWCHSSPDEAARCLEERAEGHSHVH